MALYSITGATKLCCCGKPVNMPPWRIAGVDYDFCSRACRKPYLDAFLKGKKIDMGKVTSIHFGGAPVGEHNCDNCGLPIIMAWRGRDGEYCSNKCLESKERGDKMADGTTATATVKAEKATEVKIPRTTTAPVGKKVGGKLVKKVVKKVAPKADAKAEAKAEAKPEAKGKTKVAPKAEVKGKAKAAPKAEAKTEAKPEAKSKKEKVGRAGKFSGDSKITVITKDNPYRGNRAKMFDLIKSGMTVDAYKEALAGANLRVSTRPLARAMEQELISIK